MVTIKDVAREANVSIGTVDRVIHNRGRVNEETKKRVWQVIEELQYTPNTVAQGLAKSKKRLTIGFCVPYTKVNPFFIDIRNAAERRAERLEQYGINVNFLTVSNRNNSFINGESVDVIDEMDGICTIGINEGFWKQIIDRANKNNIPVVIYNAMVDEYENMNYVGCNYEDAGKLAAGLTALLGGSDACVGVFSQMVDRPTSYKNRMKGFRTEISARYSEIKILFESSIYEDRDDNYKNVQKLLNDYPQLRVIYVLDPADYEVCKIIHELDPEHRLIVITNDLVGDQIKMVQDGIIDVTICQEPEKQGEKSLNMMFDYLVYGREPEHRVFTNLSIHIAQNASK